MFTASSTATDTTTTTGKKAISSGCFLSTAVQLKVAIYDDSISTPYDSVVFYTIQTSTGVEKWEKIYARWRDWLSDIESNNYTLRFEGPADFIVWAD